jgi:hypothetical protein
MNIYEKFRKVGVGPNELRAKMIMRAGNAPGISYFFKLYNGDKPYPSLEVGLLISEIMNVDPWVLLDGNTRYRITEEDLEKEEELDKESEALLS